MIYSSKAREGEKVLTAQLETKPFKVKLNKDLLDARWCRVFFCDIKKQLVKVPET